MSDALHAHQRATRPMLAMHSAMLVRWDRKSTTRTMTCTCLLRSASARATASTVPPLAGASVLQAMVVMRQHRRDAVHALTRASRPTLAMRNARPVRWAR